MTHHPPVSVIVPVRNGEATIGDCLRSILAVSSRSDPPEVIVVDNGSSDSTAAIAQTFPVKYVTEPARGPSCARNRGIAVSRGELLAFIDADCIATGGWLRELLRPFELADVAGVAGEIISFPPKTAAEHYMAARHPRWQEHALHARRPYAVTANVALRRGTFDQVGLFDPRMLVAQDMDFGWRFFRTEGLRMEYAPRALVLHRHRASLGAFVRQQVRWSYGHALLHAKYGLPWTLADEVRQYERLVAAALAVTRTAARHAAGRVSRRQLEFAFFEMLRCAACRAGALRGLLHTRAMSPWVTTPENLVAR
jgi:glycosyltransferase involved in cell wall biosynthesis